MSKSLRMLLLSMLVVVVATMPAMASSPTKFYWTGARNNWWGQPENWSADVDYSSASRDVGVTANNYYPGKGSADVDVIISNDARIALDASTSVGALSRIKMIKVVGFVKVSLDIGQYGYFSKMPSIDVVSGSLELKGTTARSLGKSLPTWAAKGKSNLTLDMPVVSLTSTDSLTLSIDSGVLDIKQASLLDYTNIKVRGGTLRLNAQPAAAASGKHLNMTLSSATLNIPSDITLYANYGKPASGDYLISGASLTKTGAGTLTLLRTNTTSYAAAISPDVKAVAVNGGKLVFGSARIAESSFDITVASGATLDVDAKNAIYTNGLVKLRVSGTAEIANSGIGSADSIYNASNILSLDAFNLSVDVPSGGVLTFTGDQPVKNLKGAGTVKVSGDNAVLIVDGQSKDINGFTGTLDATNVGIVKSFDNLPFEKAGTASGASMNMNAVYVYGPAMLTINSATMPDDMESSTIFLRSNYNAVTETALNASTVGDLKISGDVTLGTLKVDGSKNGVGGIIFNESSDVLTVNSLVLHANKELDTTPATYSAVDALLISGDGEGGTFVPKAISNATSDGGLASKTSIIVQGQATLKLDASLPGNNSLLLNGGTLDAANGIEIPGDLTIQAISPDYNTIKVTVNGSNVRLYEGQAGFSALKTGGDLTLIGPMSFDLKLDDTNQSPSRKYIIIGPKGTDFSQLSSRDVHINVTGDLDGVMYLSYDVHGVYGVLENYILQPRLGSEWKTVKASDTEFESRLSYDIPANVEPATLINLLVVSVDIGDEAHLSNKNSVTRARVIKGGTYLTFISSFRVNSKDNEIVLRGGLYDKTLETKVTLGWSKVSTDWTPYEGKMFFNGADVLSRDFKPIDTATLYITNPIEESPDVPPASGELSEDVTATDVVPEANVHTVTAGSQDVVLTVTGIRRLLTGSNGFVPVLVNGTYVWMNGYDPATEKFEMLYDGTYRPVSLDIKINGVSVNMASVDIAGSEPVTITVPAEFFTTTLAYTAPQEVVIVGTTANGHTITTEPISVWVKPASGYQAGTIDAGYVGRGTSDTEVTRRVADIPLGGTISFDVTGGTMPDEWLDADGIAAGVISFTVPAGTAAGVYTKTIDVYTAEGGYTYTFSYEVVEGFKINDPDEPYGSIGGLNYEARFTTANAPAGATVEWEFPTNIAWLKSAKSGDVFVVYGQLPAYVDDDEAEDDPNEYTYRVIAIVSGDTVSKDWPISVEEDTDEDEVVDHTHAAGAITFPEGKDIISADSTYSVDITFVEPQTDELEFLSLPYWLKATPKRAVVEDEEVITGYTITYKEGTEVQAGDTGVVRFEDPENGNIISWPVTFNETIQPTPPDAFTLTTDSSVSLTLGTATPPTRTLTLTTANALGTVSYSYTVTPDNGGLTVALSGNQATLTGATAGIYTVVFTATDAARATDNTATFTTTVTVSGGVTPGPQPGALVITATPNTLTFAAGSNLVQTVTLEATVDGVSYTSDKEWAVVEENRVMVSTPEESDVITITGTAPDGQSADVTITVTVTGGSQDTFTLTTDSTVSLTLGTETAYRTTLTLTPANAVGTVSYSYTVTPDNGGLTVALSGNQATLTGVTAGTYTVVFTATDSEGNTAPATTTVTVSGGVVDNTFRIERRFASYSFDISAGIVSFDVNAIVRPVNNQGAVTYTASVSPTNGLSIAVSGNVVVLGATSTGTYTVTVTGTDTATSQTATTTITVVVTSRGSLGSSGGGCDAGFGALALALAVPLFLRRRRS